MPPTTRLQVSGYRFLVRRMEHALVRGDTRMLDDPLRAQSISLAAGAVVAVVALVVCAIVAILRPADDAGDARILVVRDTGAMYVRVGDVVHPVFNLASARLVAGVPDAPRVVGQQAIDNALRGPLLGIPGAPQGIAPPLTAGESSWTVCDDARGETVVVAGPVGDRAAAPGTVLVRQRNGGAAATYLLYGGVRARVDLRHPAVVRALRLDGIEPQPISVAVLSAIPEAPEIVPPHVPHSGSPGPGALQRYPVGSVLKVVHANSGPEAAADYFVVLAGGVQRLGHVAADLIRYTGSRAGGQIPEVAPDVIGAAPVLNSLPVHTFPARSAARGARVICARWSGHPDRDAATAVLVGDEVPMSSPAARLVQADGDGPAVDAVSLPAGRSAVVRSVGLTGRGPSAGPMFLVTDSGVLHGIRDNEAADSLGITVPPQPAPWPVLSLLPRGPELSRSAASVARDGYLPSP